MPAATATPAIDAKAIFDSGDAFYHKKLYETAISDFSNAIRLDPNFARAYAGRGSAYFMQGKFDQAILLDPNYVYGY